MQNVDITTIRGRLKEKANSRLPVILPEQQTLIDWMAWEMYLLYQELGRADDNIRKTIQRRLQPDTVSRPFPAHALAQARPKQNKVVLQPDKDVFSIDRSGKEGPRQVYFSPLQATPLVNGAVQFQAAGGRLWAVSKGGTRRNYLTTANGHRLANGSLWLGIHLEESFSEEKPLSFYFDWLHTETKRKSQLYALLPLVNWKSGPGQLTVKPGLENARQEHQQYASPYLDAEYLYLYGIEQRILKEYNDCFISVSSPMPLSDFPEPILNVFGEASIREAISGRLAWVELSFPHGFSQEEIEATQVTLNCFPIVNRRMDISQDFRPSGNDNTEARPLSNATHGRAALSDTGDFFLGLQRIFTKSTTYRPVTYEDFRTAPQGCYALQHGSVEARDFRDLQGRLSEILHYLNSQSEVLKLLPENELKKSAEGLESISADLKMALEKAPLKERDMGYYLHIKAIPSDEMIQVRMWLAQGEYAYNILHPGDLLQPNDGGKGGVSEGVVVILA